jgi:hypothetical protein
VGLEPHDRQIMRSTLRRSRCLSGIKVETDHQAVIVRRGRDNGVRLPGRVEPRATGFECPFLRRVRVAPANSARVIGQADLIAT